MTSWNMIITNGYVFIVQDQVQVQDGWTLTNGSLDSSFFCKNSLHLVEQGNVKLAKSVLTGKIVSTLTARNNQLEYIVMFLNNPFPATISRGGSRIAAASKMELFVIIVNSFQPSFKEYYFPPLTNFCRPISKSVNCCNDVTARSILASSNVSEHVKRLYQCKPVQGCMF